MDMRPVAMFDSGVGGLTVLRKLRRLLPEEDIVYFGDTSRVPYGGRSPETLLQFARQDVALLRRFDPKAIVVACGTVSATGLPVLRKEIDLPICGVVVPAAQAVADSGARRVGLIGTEASIRSGAYEREIAALDPEIQVFAAACPRFVPLVESGRFRPDDPEVAAAAEEYLAPLRDEGVEALVLGCTHYPLLREVIARTMGPAVTLIDTGAVCAGAAARMLTQADLLARRERGQCRYLVSGDPAPFARLAPTFLQGPLDGEVWGTTLPES